MAISHDAFIEYLTLAKAESLTARENLIFDFRYGLETGTPQTLEEIGQNRGVTRERIRQILQRVHRKLYVKGKRAIAKGNISSASAQLLLFLESELKPNESDNLDRIVAFAMNELGYLPQKTHALPLLVSLLYGPTEQAEKYGAELLSLYQHTVNALMADRRQAIRSEDESKKLEMKFKSFLDQVMWPTQMSDALRLDMPSLLNRQREVSLDGAGEAGSFKSQKMEREVQYESLLELHLLLFLDKRKDVVFYQEQPFLIPYKHGERDRAYFPDIFCILEDGRGVVIEVKPIYQMALYENHFKWTALRTFCQEHGWGLIITDGTRSIRQLVRYPFCEEFQTALLAALDNAKDGTLSWLEYREIKDRYHATWNDFLAVILRNKLLWSLQPFTLKRRKQFRIP